MSTTAEQRAKEVAARIHRRARDEEDLISDDELGGIICAAIREAEAELVEKWQVNFEVVRKQSDTAIARAEKAEAERDAAIKEIGLWARKYALADADRAQDTSDRKNLKESLRYTEEKTRILLSALEVQAQRFFHHDGQHGDDCVSCFCIRAAREALAKVNQKWAGYEEPNARIGSGTNIPTEVAGNARGLESETASEDREIPGPVALRKIAQSTAEAPKPLCPKCGDANVGEWAFNFEQPCGLKCYACHHVWPAEPIAKSKTPVLPEWSYIQYNAILARNGIPYAIVTPDGKRSLTIEECKPLLEALNKTALDCQRDEAREQLAAVTKERNIKEHAICTYEAESAQLREQVAKLTEQVIEAATWRREAGEREAKLTADMDAATKSAKEGVESDRALGAHVNELRTQLTQAQAECAAMREALEYTLNSEVLFTHVLKKINQALSSTAGTDLFARLKAKDEEDSRRLDWIEEHGIDALVFDFHNEGNLRAAIDAALSTEVKP